MAPYPYQKNPNIMENDDNLKNDFDNFNGLTFHTLGSTNMQMAPPRNAKDFRKSSEASRDYHIFDGYKTILSSKPSRK